MMGPRTSAALISLSILLAGIPSPRASWVQNGVTICTTTGNYGKTPMIADDAGGAIMAWWDYRGGVYYDVYAQRIDASGNALWTAGGTAVCTSTGYKKSFLSLAGRLQLAPDGSGGAIVAWCDYRNGVVWNIFAQRIDANGNALWAAEGVGVCLVSGDKVGIQAVPDGSGGAIIAWCDYRSGADWDLYAQRLDADGNALWTTDGAAICAAAGNQLNLNAIPDGAGGAIMAWADSRGTSPADIYVQRIAGNGGADWTLDGVPVCAAANNQDSPDLVSDGAGGAFIVWTDARSGTRDIYARRVDAAGTPLWTADGVAICTASADQGAPYLAPDQVGGAFVSWSDNRSTSTDIYAQRINADGNVLWTANGVGICTATNDQAGSPMVPDGNGGAVIGYLNIRGTTVDVYAQKVDADGNRLWAGLGAPISTAGGQHEYIRIVPDGVGGAILMWYFFRSSPFGDLYAQRVDAAGHTIVATLLENYTAARSEDGITITWTLSEAEDGIEWMILRAVEANGPFEELHSKRIVGDGLSFTFDDEEGRPGTSYWYRIEYRDASEWKVLFETGPVTTPAMQTTLFQNRPNPFNPSTTIGYYVRERCAVKLDIYSVSGNLVRRLVEGSLDEGSYTAEWDGRNGSGDRVGSGVYFYRLNAGKEVRSRKMILLE
jgi:hypothetical protein